MNSPFVPKGTPLALKCLLLATLFLSLVFPFLGPYLVLSKEGIAHLYLWQFASYLFIHPFPSGIFQLALNLYVLWVFGTALIERIHLKSFFALYFGAGIFAGLLAWGAMFLFPPTPLSGSSPALYATLIAWVILNPESELFLFFAIPFKARSLLIVLLGLGLLVHLASASWIPLFAEVGAVLFGYIFTLIASRCQSPFPFLFPLERAVLRFVERLHFREHKRVKHTKIYDIQSGEPVLSDDEFMDAMLARISLYGEASLTPQEKGRMKQISLKSQL